MTELILVLNEFAAAWWAWTVTSTGQGLLLLAVVALVLWGWKSMRPGLRYGLLLVVLVKLAVPPVIGTSYGFSDLMARAFAEAPSPPPVIQQVQVTTTHTAARVSEAPVVMVPSAPVMPRLSPTAWLLLLEGAGALAVLVLVARQLRATKSALRSAERGDDTSTARLRRMAGEMGVRRAPRLYVSAEFNAPQSGGVVRPFVLLPSWVLALDGEELDILLAHELAHIRRMDALVNGIQALAQALLWWNPAVWWLNRRIREEREFCCDDLVLSQGIASGAAYSRALVNVAERVSQPQPTWALAGMADNFGAIDRRVRRALEGGQGQRRWRRYGALATLLLVAGWVLPGATDGAEKDFDATEAANVETGTADEIEAGEALPQEDIGSSISNMRFSASTRDGAVTRFKDVDFMLNFGEELGEVGLKAKQLDHTSTGDDAGRMLLNGEVVATFTGLTVTADTLLIAGRRMIRFQFNKAVVVSADYGTISAEQVVVDVEGRKLGILNGTVDEGRLKAALGEDAKNTARGEWLTLPLGAARRVRVTVWYLELDVSADVLPSHEMKLADLQGTLIGSGTADQMVEFKKSYRKAIENGQAKYFYNAALLMPLEETTFFSVGNEAPETGEAVSKPDVPAIMVHAKPVKNIEENAHETFSIALEIERKVLGKSDDGVSVGEKDMTSVSVPLPRKNGDWYYHVTTRDAATYDLVVVRAFVD